MPSYLSDYPSVYGYSWGEDALPGNPELAALAMQIVAAVSMIENTRAHIMALILGSDLEVTMAIYGTMWSANHKKEALAAAAVAGLSEEEAAVLKRVEQIGADTVTTRNWFAHRIWGWAKDLPDALLLVPQGYDGNQIMQVPGGKGFILPAPHDKVKVFRRADLAQAVEDA